MRFEKHSSELFAPGIIKTKFSRAVRRFCIKSSWFSSAFQLWEGPEAESFAAQFIPLGRFGDAENCSGAVSFLCSDAASYITGETVPITGGMHAHL